jgi:hypothetical protein
MASKIGKGILDAAAECAPNGFRDDGNTIARAAHAEETTIFRVGKDNSYE